jgi:tetratricopeptide (TPR) repeat protein
LFAYQFGIDAKLPKAKNPPQGRFRGGLLLVVGTAVLGMGCPAPAQEVLDQTTRQAMQQGGEAMAAGNFSAAVTAYSTVTQKAPAFAEGYLNLGLALFQASQLDEATKALGKALQLKPSLHGANLFLGIVAYRQNHFKDAETLLLRETRLDPHSAKAFMWLGICRLAANDPAGAIAPLDKAYALDPKDVDILYHRGRAYLLVANASYEAMFLVNRDSVRVHQVLGEAYAQAYRNDEAIKEFKRAVEMAPAQPGLHEELGDQYWIAGDVDKSAAEYRNELKVDPYAATSMYKLGSLLVRNQNPAEGVELLRSALKADPTLADAHYYLGDGLMDLEQDQDAIGEFRQAIGADPASDRAMSSYYKLAQIYRKLHDQDQAQAAMQNFLRMRSASKAQQDNRTANVVRKRAELPVDDPDRSSP